VGRAIVKAAPDRDLYMVWSSIVDAVVAVGTRAEMVEYARQDWRLDDEHAEAALVRADTLGSSDRAIGFGRWGDDVLPVREGSPPDGWYHIRRDRLVDYVEALLRDDGEAATALLERDDDEDDDVPG
jgi:hypothetical protein